ncbi:hypothetical protein [Actinokineospora sp. NBRC 105648]|uniref:hypothetical protein n=1 Tax=Actinokineospora sp. NBRC 105648 TaxID=3032206 RepID=UPI0024A43C0E|nr:hypothetical protein [Actinokineospora sp. NBRC 105648]GLZ42451.1 hypothetical protein Acsp05_60750 [Actinokineospora sp. NBRC 105648]
MEQHPDLWEWADQVAQSAPLWTDERWERANAILGTKIAQPRPDRTTWSEAA